MGDRFRRNVLWFFGFGVVYAVSAHIALTYLLFPDGVAVIWPASGVLLAVFLLSPRSQWWIVAVVFGGIDFLFETVSGSIPFLPSAIFSLSLMLQAIVASWLLQRFVAQRLHFESLNEVYLFLLWGCVLPTVVFAVPPAIASAMLLEGDFLLAWWRWSVTGAMGVLVVCPLILTLYPDFVTSLRQLPGARKIELFSLLLVSVLVTRFVFTTDDPTGSALAPYGYLVLPVLLLVAIRFTSSGTILASFLLATVAVWYDAIPLLGRGNSLIALEAFLFVVISGTLLVAALVTERKQAEKALSDHREHLESLVAERTTALELANKELESFSYSVSHDLRAPLRIINGFGTALRDDYSEQIDDTGKKYLQRICQNAIHMGRLIEDIISLSNVARCEVKSAHTNLSLIAHRVVNQLVAIEPDRKVAIDIEERVYGWGDERLLYIVMDNLLGNAWKYTGVTERAHIEFYSTRSNGCRMYVVKDNGVGFDMTYADKLFGAFQRLHKSSDFEGTGIGLATVARIIHRHGGKVWAESETGKGATFYFTLGKSGEETRMSEIVAVE